MSGVVRRNIGALLEVRRREERQQTRSDRLAARISHFAGSMTFVYVHGAVYGTWLVWNAIPGLPHWDPYPFVMLAMFASVEAIFLSTFILITQNRMQTLADRRAELDLQISLLAEHELTQALRLIDAVATRLGVTAAVDDLEDAKKDVDPVKVASEIEKAEP